MLNVEESEVQIVVTEYGGHDGRYLRTYVFNEEDDGFKYGGWTGSHGSSNYPVESAPEKIREVAEEQTDKEIVDREIPIRAGQCTECGRLIGVESEEKDVKIESECPICGEVEVKIT